MKFVFKFILEIPLAYQGCVAPARGFVRVRPSVSRG
jgi:hypothetical protein